jgi:hypothetical protein
MNDVPINGGSNEGRKEGRTDELNVGERLV